MAKNGWLMMIQVMGNLPQWWLASRVNYCLSGRMIEWLTYLTYSNKGWFQGVTNGSLMANEWLISVDKWLMMVNEYE